MRGPAGWGEWSPFGEYGPQLAARWWHAAVEAATVAWPPARRDDVPVNAIVPAVDPQTAHRIVRTSGCATAKVKVGVGDDHARVEAVRDALGADGRLRIDVNAVWDVDTAIRRLRELARYELEYVEQPVADLADFGRLRAKVDVPLAADESVRLAPDPLRIPGIAAADVVVLKVQPLGGVHRCLQVAEALGRPVIVSSAVETSVGLAAGLALAAALPDLAGACGLGTMSLLADAEATAGPIERPPIRLEAIRRARAFRPFDLVWLEEPTIPDDIAGHVRIVREGGMPIASGENCRTLWEFKQLIAAGGVGYPEPDVTNCGGVTVFMKVAHLAEAHNLPVTSHGAHDLHVHETEDVFIVGKLQAGYTRYLAAWRALPPSVRRVIVLRDTPKMRADTLVCVERAMRRRAPGQPAGPRRRRSSGRAPRRRRPWSSPGRRPGSR